MTSKHICESQLTLAVSGRRPDETFQFSSIRKRAAVTSTGLILIQASFAAMCSGKVAVP
jgi:hypothetical protein